MLNLLHYMLYVLYSRLYLLYPRTPHLQFLKGTRRFCRTPDGQNHRSIEWGGVGNGVGEGRRGGRIGKSLRPGQCLRKYMVCEDLRFLVHFLVPRTHEFSLFGGGLSRRPFAALHGFRWIFKQFWTI